MPLIVHGYDPGWPALFEQEAARVRQALEARCVAVEHIGSTAVPGLAARPVIDLLLGLPGPATSADTRAIKRLGYAHLRARRDGRLVFRCGAPRTSSLHVTEIESGAWRAAVAFRDHLRLHPDVVAQYAELKLKLAAIGSHAAYSSGKATFIASVLRQAAPRGALPIRSDRAGSRTLRDTEV